MVKALHSEKEQGLAYRYALLFLIALIWGSQFLFNHFALQVFTAESVAWLRAAIGFLTLSFFMALTPVSRDSKTSKGSASRYWMQIVLVGFFEATLPFFLVAW